MKTEPTTTKKDNSKIIFIILGVLWLLLAGFILYFQFSGVSDQIEIEWVTETEFETAGFNIYRGNEPEGDFVQINDQLLPSEGNSTSGARYTYLDKNVVPGQTYYYELEEVEFDNSRQRFDLGSEQNPVVEIWALLLATIGLLVGLFLLVTAFKQEKKEWIPTKSQDLTQISSGEL